MLHVAAATLAVSDPAGAAAFHRDVLGLPVADGEHGPRLAVGDGAIEVVATRGAPAPFHHVAYRVARDRFDAAATWLAGRTPLLPLASGTRVRWEFWNADACYALDPAGTVLELIAFDDLPPSGCTGVFSPDEVLGIAEVGFAVRDVLATCAALAELGLADWEGEEPDPEFSTIGERGATLIVVQAPRPWSPTELVATAPPMHVTFAGGARPGAVVLEGAVVEVV